jgi:hypothetical protein
LFVFGSRFPVIGLCFWLRRRCELKPQTANRKPETENAKRETKNRLETVLKPLVANGAEWDSAHSSYGPTLIVYR